MVCAPVDTHAFFGACVMDSFATGGCEDASSFVLHICVVGISETEARTSGASLISGGRCK